VNGKKKRLTLDLDPPLQRRLKAIAALKGISMRQYCQTAIDKELTRDEAQGLTALPFGQEALDRLAALQSEVSQGRTLPDDSTEFIRESRAQRAATK
jgi:predicted transcriptional regulator